MVTKRKLLTCILALTSYSIFAAAQYKPSVFSISGGPAWGSAGETQTIFLQPTVLNTYTVNNRSNFLGIGELFWGCQRALTPQLFGQLGVDIAATTFAHFSGNVWQDANPEFNNFLYKWKAQDTRFALKGKLIKENSFYHLSPYLHGSIGVGLNRASNYQSYPYIFEALPEPNFKSHTTAAFTYSVGAGIQRALNNHMQVGVGYEFIDWGKNAFSRAPEQTMGNGLSLDHFYTNGLMFTLTYLS